MKISEVVIGGEYGWSTIAQRDGAGCEWAKRVVVVEAATGTVRMQIGDVWGFRYVTKPANGFTVRRIGGDNDGETFFAIAKELVAPWADIEAHRAKADVWAGVWAGVWPRMQAVGLVSKWTNPPTAGTYGVTVTPEMAAALVEWIEANAAKEKA